MSVTRRRFVGGLSASLAALSLPRRARASAPLVPDPAGLLDLPAGFSYTILEARGGLMDDGYVVPGRPDGMGLFELADGTLALMRNHELLPISLAGPYAAGYAPPEAFDPAGMGCVTRLVLDPVTYARLSSNLVLCGTSFNCAGGVSPWGWLSCEEIFSAGHGYVFLCDPEATSVQPAVRLSYLGRCEHEAAAVDDVTGDVYLTEDRVDSALYRSTAGPGVPALQAMRVVGIPNFDTATMLVGDIVDVEWVTLTRPTPKKNTLRVEAASLGGARVARGEGMVADGRSIYVCATIGGAIGKGQIFRLDLDTQQLECIVASADPLVLDMPDNLTVAPWGQVFMGENGGTTNYLRCIDSSGAICDVAHQASGTSELSGLCFSPTGDALFCNLQQDGLTVVITGDFEGTFGL